MRRTNSAVAPDDPIVEFFDRRAADYDREYADETPGGYALRERRRKVLELFDQPGGRVLDVGCGPGVMARETVSRGCHFWGVDPSSRMIDVARSHFGEDDRVRFLMGDAERLQFADNSFDAVLCMGVMDSLRNGQRAVGEMVRVLRTGGTLIVTVTNLYSPYAWWKNYAFYPAVAVWHRFRARLGDSTITPGRLRSGRFRALYSRRTARDLLESRGTQVLKIVPYYYNVFLSPLDELMPGAALRVMKHLEERVWARPEWVAVGWILKAKKN
jgi:ubiquinone/menaquinone biosynthesis C-methylase UbiE